MGLQNESHRSTTDEESLALYNNLEHSESSTSTLTLPSQTATPDEVRRFLAQLLIASRDLSQDHAHGIASRWGPGTGRELAKYNAAMYTSIFGPEDGWLLFKDLHILNYKTEQAQMSRLQRYKFRYICYFCLLLIAGGVCWTWIRSPLSDDETLIPVCSIAFGLLGIFCTGGFAMLEIVELVHDPEARAEGQLQRAFIGCGQNREVREKIC